MGLKLEELMKMPCFKDAKLISGNIKGRDIYVKGVTIIEAPDIVSWINGGELLLTSFYGIDKNIEAQKCLIKGIANKGAAAILIKVSRFLSQISQEIIDLGNEINFPIIQISGDTKYIDITYPVMSEIFNDQVNKLNYYKLCHKKFSELSFKMKGISSVAKTLGELINNPVVIFDNELNPIAWNKKEYKDIKIKDENFKQTLRKGYVYYNIEIENPRKKEDAVIMLQPIQVLNEIRGYLGVHEANKEIEDLDFIAFESAVNSLRLEMLKDIAVNEVKLKYKYDLIESLINGSFESPEDIYDKSGALGLNLKRKFIVIIINISNYNGYIKPNKTLADGLDLAFRKIFKIIDRVAYSYTTNYISTKKGDNIIILWPIEDESEIKNIKIAIKNFGRKVKKEIQSELSQIKIAIGIGNIARDIRCLGRSYYEALDSVKLCHTVQDIESVIFFDELGIYKLLLRYENREELKQFIHPSLLKLKEYDDETNSELVETLENYLLYNQNATKTGEEMFIHYKTMLYRLNRIKDITNLDLDDRTDMLEVEVGLKILKIISPNNL